MRDFSNKDRSKKSSRIELGENPANLTQEKLALLEPAVKAALKDGYLSCPVGWKIAKDMDVPRIAIGAIVDRLGIRVTNCQIGFFKVDKTSDSEPSRELSAEITEGLRELHEAGNLTCRSIFELSDRFKTAPLLVSRTATVLGFKIRNCQLGCF